MTDHIRDATKKVLSPAAQAVDHAIAARIYLLGEIAPSKQVAAAAIRELMNQVAPHPQGFPTCQYMDGYLKSKKRLRMRSLAIADELEGLGND